MPPTIQFSMTPSIAPTILPTLSPTDNSSSIATHAVVWGYTGIIQNGSCATPDSVIPNQALDLICGGRRIRLDHVSAAKCEPFANSISQVKCKLNETDYMNFTYPYSSSTILFSCISDTNLERSASARLANIEIENTCLDTSNVGHISTPVASTASAAFMSLGRFCIYDLNYTFVMMEILFYLIMDKYMMVCLLRSRIY